MVHQASRGQSLYKVCTSEIEQSNCTCRDFHLQRTCMQRIRSSTITRYVNVLSHCRGHTVLTKRLGPVRTVPVQRVVISDDNFITDQSSMPASIHLVDGRPSTLRCVVFGGYPPPNVELFVGGREITDDFQFASNASLSGRSGLRLITYRSERWTYSFQPSARDDQKPLRCIATVAGQKQYEETVLVSIDCKCFIFHHHHHHHHHHHFIIIINTGR